MYAISEVAKVRNDSVKISVTTVEILVLHAILTIGGYIAVAVICMTVSEVQVNIPLFLILSTTIFFTAIGCEWFYQGTEDFKYVTTCGLIVKTVSVVMLFMFVKTKDDILWYGAYNVIGVLGGNLFNFIRLRRFVDCNVVRVKDLHPFRHLKPALHIFVYNIIISIYLKLNTVMLGFLKDVIAVGYFTAATKLMYMAMSFSNSLGAVMMPRASNLIAEHKMDEFRSIVQRSYDFIVAISIPLALGLFFTSRSAVLLLCGDSFVHAIFASQIVAINIVSIGISGVIGIQVLYPLGKINIVILCTFLGAVTNVVLNVLLIPVYGHNGTAIAFAVTEAVVTGTMLLIGRKFIPVKLVKKQYIHYLVAGIAMAFTLFLIESQSMGNLPTFLLMIVSGILVYGICLIVLNDPIGILILNTVKNKVR